MGESSEWGDLLVSDILLSGGAVSLRSVSDSVDLLVHFSSVVVSQLSGSGNTELDSGWMPSSDTSDLSKTSMGLLLQVSNSESLDDSGDSLTLGNSDNVDHLVLLEDLINLDFLLEKSVGKINLLGNSSSVDLDFDDVVLLLSEVELVHLGVGDDSDDGAVFLDSLEGDLDVLGRILGNSLLVLGEGLSLGALPVLVESSEGVLVELVGPDGGQGSETSWGFDVSDDSDDDHGWGFDDGDGFDDLLLVQLGAWLIDISDDVAHTGLESGEGSQVDWFLWVILGERPYSSSVMSGSLSGAESQVTLSGTGEFSVTH